MVFCLVYYYIPGNCDGRPLCVCVICVNGSRDRSDMSGAHTIWRQKSIDHYRYIVPVERKEKDHGIIIIGD